MKVPEEGGVREVLKLPSWQCCQHEVLIDCCYHTTFHFGSVHMLTQMCGVPNWYVGIFPPLKLVLIHRNSSVQFVSQACSRFCQHKIWEEAQDCLSVVMGSGLHSFEGVCGTRAFLRIQFHKQFKVIYGCCSKENVFFSPWFCVAAVSLVLLVVLVQW